MKPIAILLTALTVTAGSLPTWAQAPTADGEVTRIDKAAGKLTLRHGEIRELDMPPMTMVFRVLDPRLLEGLAVGDRVRFSADKRGGSYTVLSLVKAPA